VLLNLHNLAQEYLISFSIHLNTFKSYKGYLVKYWDTKSFNYNIHSIKRVNWDKKITIVNLWEFCKYSWYWWDNFSKLAGYGLLFSFTFLSFFPFHYLFLPKLVRPAMLGSLTLTPRFFHSLFLHVFPLIFLFLSGIYKILLGFLMDSNINWSKLSPLINIFHNYKLCTYVVFSMVVLQQT